MAEPTEVWAGVGPAGHDALGVEEDAAAGEEDIRREVEALVTEAFPGPTGGHDLYESGVGSLIEEEPQALAIAGAGEGDQLVWLIGER